MKKLFLLLIVLFSLCAMAQVTTQPAYIEKGYEGEIKVYFDPAQGSGQMVGATKCYAHTGLITAQSTSNGDWKYATPTWRGGDSKYQMTQEGDLWVLTISNIYDYYGCPKSENIKAIAFVFNDGPNGSKEGKTADGKDIIINLVEPGLHVQFTAPTKESSYLVQLNDIVTFECSASASAELKLYINDNLVKTTNGTTLSYSQTFSATGDYHCVIVATKENQEESATLNVCVVYGNNEAVRPEGIKHGITLYPDDPTKATFCLYAKDNKGNIPQSVFMIGSFNDWSYSADYQMKYDPTDGSFWLTLENLTAGVDYLFQYAIKRANGSTIVISDPYSTRLLNEEDHYIPDEIYPDKIEYPAQTSGYITVFNTAEPKYAWSDATLNFVRPDKNNLVIYELWMYDFSPFRSFDGVKARLDYIQNLGVNAIEFMPLHEFDDNISWGYSPNHYFAIDKAYGTDLMFKELVDEIHKRGMAVIVDMVFNHATDNSPLNKIFAIADNPYFNINAPHEDEFFSDFNHDFVYTKEHFTRCLNYWLQEYKIDGFRMDLSHGFCGPDCSNSLENVIDFFADGVQAVDNEAYFILEHWNFDQRSDLVAQGMLCWQNTNNAYCQTAMGWLQDGDSFFDASKDGYVSYAESHDEERCFYKAKVWGKGDINQSAEVRLSRIAANVAMNVMLNGPKMIWQFEEIGYDFTIDHNGRTGTKPLPELIGYMQDPLRMNQYKKIAQICQLRTRILPHVFEGNPTAYSIASGVANRYVVWGSGDERVCVVSNLGTEQSQFALPTGSNWYSYLDAASSSIQGGSNVTLKAGEVKVFTSKPINLPTVPDDYNYDDYTATDNAHANIDIYPTYTDGDVYIASDSKVESVRVYDTHGRLLMTKCAEKINLSSLPRGLYIVVVSTSTEQYGVKVARK